MQSSVTVDASGPTSATAATASAPAAARAPRTRTASYVSHTHTHTLSLLHFLNFLFLFCTQRPSVPCVHIFPATSVSHPPRLKMIHFVYWLINCLSFYGAVKVLTQRRSSKNKLVIQCFQLVSLLSPQVLPISQTLTGMIL